MTSASVVARSSAGNASAERCATNVRSTRRYRVERTFVAHRSALALPADERATTLALVTCYPFDAIDPGTPLRYAVVTRAVP